MSAVVIPFPGPKKPEPTRCPQCGWKMPGEVLADRESVKRDLVLYFSCPECESSLILPITFDVE